MDIKIIDFGLARKLHPEKEVNVVKKKIFKKGNTIKLN
jgi:hypothetical protein